MVLDIQQQSSPTTGTLPAADKGEGPAASSCESQVRKRPKRRAADARIRKFLDLYESTGQSLGRGSFGHVHAYRNKRTNQEVAVKIVEKNKRRSRYKVLKEIEIFHHCHGHPNILQLIEYFEEDDRFYLVFEKMEGGSLLDGLELCDHVTEGVAKEIVRNIAEALKYLHGKGIAHRDLKPENVLLCRGDGTLYPVKICDFDLASGVQVDVDTGYVTTPELQSPVGSADFMAPEVVDVWRNQAWIYDKQCDLWSLGVIMYVILCGYKPFYFHERCNSRYCDWRNGGFCDDCQEMLFECITEGVFYFPSDDWSHISNEAKDLVRRLLVRDPKHRLTADQVLAHPWLSNAGSEIAENGEECSVIDNNSQPIARENTASKDLCDGFEMLDVNGNSSAMEFPSFDSMLPPICNSGGKTKTNKNVPPAFHRCSSAPQFLSSQVSMGDWLEGIQNSLPYVKEYCSTSSELACKEAKEDEGTLPVAIPCSTVSKSDRLKSSCASEGLGVSLVTSDYLSSAYNTSDRKSVV